MGSASPTRTGAAAAAHDAERDGATPEHDGATPERDGETLPIDARTRGAGAKRSFLLGNGSPTSSSDAHADWQPADGDSSLRDSPRFGLPAGRNERNRISRWLISAVKALAPKGSSAV